MSSDLLPQVGRLLIILVRHGKTQDNAENVLRGWADAHLSAEGEMEARIAATKIVSYDPKMVYTSDFTRDSKTGSIIGEYFGLPYETDYGLRTANMGEWTEKSESETLDGVRDWYMSQWKESPSGESYNDFCQRFFTCIDAKLDLAKLQAFNPIVCVCHGRCFAALESRYTGVAPWLAHMPLTGGIALLRDNGYNFPPYKIEYVGETEPVLTDA